MKAGDYCKIIACKDTWCCFNNYTNGYLVKVLYKELLVSKCTMWRCQYLNRKETNRLAQFVLMMESGSLLEWVKKENGELADAIISVKKSEE